MSDFRRAGLTVLAGSAGGVGLGLLLTPVLSRLVTPGVFGSFMTLSAIASVFVGVSTMRLEVAGQREHDGDEAARVLGLGLSLALGLGLVITLVASLGWLAGAWPATGLVVGPMVTVASTQLIGTAWLARQLHYTALARANFVQGGGMALSQTGLAVLSPTVGALVVGYLAARLAWARHLPGLLWRRRDLVPTWRRHRVYALMAGGSAGINSLGGQIPVLVPALIYGDQAAGWFAMAVRILVTPLSLVGQAAAAAAMGELSAGLRDRSPGTRQLLRRGVRDLLIVGAVPALLFGVLGPTMVPRLLGSQWNEVGGIVSVLAVGAWAQFAVAPFSQTLNLAGRSSWLLRWDLTRLLLITASFVVPGLLELSIMATTAVYSTALLALYLAMGLMCDRALATPR